MWPPGGRTVASRITATTMKDDHEEEMDHEVELKTVDREDVKADGGPQRLVDEVEAQTFASGCNCPHLADGATCIYCSTGDASPANQPAVTNTEECQ